MRNQHFKLNKNLETVSKQLLFCLSLVLLTFPTFSNETSLHTRINESKPQTDPPVTLEIDFETEKKGKALRNKSGQMSMTFQKDCYAIRFDVTDQNSSSTIIFDHREKTMTTITIDKSGKSSAVIMPLIQLKRGVTQDFVGEITKTSSSKKILGYQAHKYIIVSKDGTSTESWIASIPSFEWKDLYRALSSSDYISNSSFAPIIEDIQNAFSLESHATTKGGKIVTHMYVRAIREGAEADLSALEIPRDAEVQDLTSVLRF